MGITETKVKSCIMGEVLPVKSHGHCSEYERRGEVESHELEEPEVGSLDSAFGQNIIQRQYYLVVSAEPPGSPGIQH